MLLLDAYTDVPINAGGQLMGLERDVTTTALAKAILRLKTLAFIPS